MCCISKQAETGMQNRSCIIIFKECNLVGTPINEHEHYPTNSRRELFSLFCSKHAKAGMMRMKLSSAPDWGGSESVSVLLLLSSLWLPPSSSVAIVLWIFWYLQKIKKKSALVWRWDVLVSLDYEASPGWKGYLHLAQRPFQFSLAVIYRLHRILTCIYVSLDKMCLPHSWSGWIKFHFQSPDVSLTPLVYTAVLYELNAVLTKAMHPHPTIYPPSSLRSLFPHPHSLLSCLFASALFQLTPWY